MKRRGLKEPVWGNLKFPKEDSEVPQEGSGQSRSGGAHTQQGFEKSFQSTYMVPWEKQDPVEKEQRGP